MQKFVRERRERGRISETWERIGQNEVADENGTQEQGVGISKFFCEVEMAAPMSEDDVVIGVIDLRSCRSWVPDAIEPKVPFVRA